METKLSVYELVDVMVKLWLKGDSLEIAERLKELPALVAAAVGAQSVEWLRKERGDVFAHGFATMLGRMSTAR